MPRRLAQQYLDSYVQVLNFIPKPFNLRHELQNKFHELT